MDASEDKILKPVLKHALNHKTRCSRTGPHLLRCPDTVLVLRVKLWARHFVELMGSLKWDQLMVGLVYLEIFTLRLAEENHPGFDFTSLFDISMFVPSG